MYIFYSDREDVTNFIILDEEKFLKFVQSPICSGETAYTQAECLARFSQSHMVTKELRDEFETIAKSVYPDCKVINVDANKNGVDLPVSDETDLSIKPLIIPERIHKAFKASTPTVFGSEDEWINYMKETTQYPYVPTIGLYFAGTQRIKSITKKMPNGDGMER